MGRIAVLCTLAALIWTSPAAAALVHTREDAGRLALARERAEWAPSKVKTEWCRRSVHHAGFECRLYFPLSATISRAGAGRPECTWRDAIKLDGRVKEISAVDCHVPVTVTPPASGST